MANQKQIKRVGSGELAQMNDDAIELSRSIGDVNDELEVLSENLDDLDWKIARRDALAKEVKSKMRDIQSRL